MLGYSWQARPAISAQPKLPSLIARLTTVPFREGSQTSFVTSGLDCVTASCDTWVTWSHETEWFSVSALEEISQERTESDAGAGMAGNETCV